MKEYINPQPNGAVEFKSTDWIDILQKQPKDVVIALIKGLTGVNAKVIYGCGWSVVGPNIIIAPGYVFINDNVHYYAGATIALGAGVTLVQTTNVLSQRKFKVGGLQNAITETVVVLQAGNIAGGIFFDGVNDPTTITEVGDVPPLDPTEVEEVLLTVAPACLTFADQKLKTILEAMIAKICELETVIGITSSPNNLSARLSSSLPMILPNLGGSEYHSCGINNIGGASGIMIQIRNLESVAPYPTYYTEYITATKLINAGYYGLLESNPYQKFRFNDTISSGYYDIGNNFDGTDFLISETGIYNVSIENISLIVTDRTADSFLSFNGSIGQRKALIILCKFDGNIVTPLIEEELTEVGTIPNYYPFDTCFEDGISIQCDGIFYNGLLNEGDKIFAIMSAECSFGVQGPEIELENNVLFPIEILPGSTFTIIKQ